MQHSFQISSFFELWIIFVQIPFLTKTMHCASLFPTLSLSLKRKSCTEDKMALSETILNPSLRGKTYKQCLRFCMNNVSCAAFKVTRNQNTSLCLHDSVLWRGYMAWNSYLCKQQMQANEKRIITMNRTRVFIYLLQTYFCFHT